MKRLLPSISFIIVICFFVVSCFVRKSNKIDNVSQLSHHENINNITSSSVTIYTENGISIGSGIYIDSKIGRGILTAKHVASELKLKSITNGLNVCSLGVSIKDNNCESVSIDFTGNTTFLLNDE